MELYIQLILSISMLIISAGISWGIAQNKLKELERRMSKVEQDHDILVRLDEKVGLLVSFFVDRTRKEDFGKQP